MDIENKIVKVDELPAITQVKYIKKAVYANGLITHLGKAAAGTTTSAETWQICSFIYDDDDNITDILYAEGSTDFTFEMDEYDNYEYS